MASPTGHDQTSRSQFLSHLRHLVHWTFLLALVIVITNVAVNSRTLSAVAATLLLVALVYDVYEFYAER